jgi:hypothetical protein
MRSARCETLVKRRFRVHGLDSRASVCAPPLPTASRKLGERRFRGRQNTHGWAVRRIRVRNCCAGGLPSLEGQRSRASIDRWDNLKHHGSLIQSYFTLILRTPNLRTLPAGAKARSYTLILRNWALHASTLLKLKLYIGRTVKPLRQRPL